MSKNPLTNCFIQSSLFVYRTKPSRFAESHFADLISDRKLENTLRS